MGYRNQGMIEVDVRQKSHKSPLAKTDGQSFQLEARPKETLSGEALVKRFAEFCREPEFAAAFKIHALEGFIARELQAGNRLDFGFVSFYPHVSGTIPTRDADPAKEGLRVIGAVKGREKLRDVIGNRLMPVNRTSKRAVGHIYSVSCDGLVQPRRGRIELIAADRDVFVTGWNFFFASDDPEEGVWLEDWSGKRVVTGIISDHTINMLTCVFPGPIEPGAYTLVVGTRLDKGKAYRVNRFLHKVRVV